MPKPIRLTFGNVITGGEISAETKDRRKVALRKIEPEPVCCLPAGSECHVIGPGIGRPIAVNSVTVEPGKNGKYEFFHIFPNVLVRFFPKHGY